MIPNDVCPSINSQSTMASFNSQTRFNQTFVETVYDQDEYGYTLSLTLNVNSTHCYTRDPILAAKYCHLFHFSDAFMLYFDMPNMVRFHFFANKYLSLIHI